MCRRHKLGDGQIITLWEGARALKDGYDDMNFTPPSLARITAYTLIVYGDRDPLYPVEMAIDMYRAIPRSALWIVPNGGSRPYLLRRRPSVRPDRTLVLSDAGRNAKPVERLQYLR